MQTIDLAAWFLILASLRCRVSAVCVCERSVCKHLYRWWMASELHDVSRSLLRQMWCIRTCSITFMWMTGRSSDANCTGPWILRPKAASSSYPAARVRLQLPIACHVLPDSKSSMWCWCLFCRWWFRGQQFVSVGGDGRRSSRVLLLPKPLLYPARSLLTGQHVRISGEGFLRLLVRRPPSQINEWVCVLWGLRVIIWMLFITLWLKSNFCECFPWDFSVNKFHREKNSRPVPWFWLLKEEQTRVWVTRTASSGVIWLCVLQERVCLLHTNRVQSRR